MLARNAERVLDGEQCAVWIKETFLKGQRAVYKTGGAIFTQHESATRVFYLASGQVKLCMFTEWGKESIIMHVLPGGIFGEVTAFYGEPYDVAAIATVDSEVYSLPMPQLSGLMGMEGFSLFLIRNLAYKVRLLGRHLMGLTFYNSYGRVAQTLLDYIDGAHALDPLAENGTLLITHQELANYLGINRVTVTNILNTFCKEGLIKKDKGKISVIHRKGLENWMK